MKKFKKGLLNTMFLSSMTISAGSTTANAAVLDFESYVAGTIIDSEYDPDVVVSAVNYSDGPDAAVVFDSNNPTGNDFDLGGPFTSNNPELSDEFDPGNILIIHETNNCSQNFCENPDDEGSRNAGAFFFEFSEVITLESIDFFDIEIKELAGNEIRLFDSDDIEILPGTFYVPDTGGDNMWGQLVFNVDNIKRIELNMGGSGAIDNIKFSAFNSPEVPVSEVPVPPALWLFGSGILGLIGIGRRKI